MCNLAALARIFDSTANSTAHASPRLRRWQCPVPLLGTPQESDIATSEGCLPKASSPQPLACGWAPYLLLRVTRGTLKLEALWLKLVSCLLEDLAMFSVQAWCKGWWGVGVQRGSPRDGRNGCWRCVPCGGGVVSLLEVHRGMVGLGLWRGAQWGEGMGIWGVERGWVSGGALGGVRVGLWGRTEGAVGVGPRWGAMGWEAMWGAVGMGPWGGEGAGHRFWETGSWGFVPG